MHALWKDTRGGVITTELVLVASFVTATLLAGLGVLKSKINGEFVHLASVVEAAKDGDQQEPLKTLTGGLATDEFAGVEFAGQVDTFVLPAESNL